MIEKVEKFKIDEIEIGDDNPTFFIADIAANHDGDIERAKNLIYLAKEAGANAAKFQHFKAETIVSDHGFKALKNQKSHQANWRKSVFEPYKDASVSFDWTEKLKETCDKVGIVFFTSPYSKDIVDHIDPYVSAYKIGSGDITWIEMVEYIASKDKPYIIASGASTLEDVKRAVDAGLNLNKKLCLMQCNTNYTASLENFKFINLSVLELYRKIYPKIVIGLSDHTPGHATVLGAVAYGAKMIEKHFTDDNNREGPDHKFSMDPKSWKEMVERTRELENAIGDGVKRIEENENETVILQRRSIRLNCDLEKGSILKNDNLEVLRPCPNNGIPPFEKKKVTGKKITKNLKKGDHIKWEDLE